MKIENGNFRKLTMTKIIECENIQIFECTICDHEFNTKTKLNIHIKIHSHFRPFNCVDCYQTYPSHQYLQNHRHFIHGKRHLQIL